MGIWDIRFLDKLKSLGIHIDMYGRYVDDILKALPPINRGWDYDTKTNKMTYSDTNEHRDIEEPTARTARILHKIANSLEANIQLTYDTPDMNTDKRMPVLDLKVWIEKNRICHTFYKKAVSSNFTILKRSALSESTKSNSTFQECIRRVNNIDMIQPWKEVVKHVSDYSWSLKISGYNETQRYRTIKGAIDRALTIREEVRNGVRDSINRSKSEIQKSKIDKMDWSNTWFLKGEVGSTVSCPVTVDGTLRKQLSRTLNDGKTGGKILVIEDGGRPITCGLRTKDPRRPPGCIFGDRNCIVSHSEQCDRQGVIYQIVCNDCRKTVDETDGINGESSNYIGLTRGSVHSRMSQHLKTRNSQSSACPLYRHDRDHHHGVRQDYSTKILAAESKIVRLYTLEALMIEKQESTKSMNERNERGRGGVVRLTAARVTH